MRIKIGILSYEGSIRRQACRDTWCSLTQDYWFLLGYNQVGETHLMDCQCPDDYNHLSNKTRAFCDIALNNYDDWDYLFKCDDDTYVHVPRLLAYDPGDRDYVGLMLQSRYAAGGAGYLLSRKAAEIIAEKLTADGGQEDVFVGNCLLDHGIKIHHDNRFWAWGSHYPTPANDKITSHYCTPKRMRHIHELNFGSNSGL